MKSLKPYYETENGKLYHGNCLDIIPKLKKVDLTITSPPYDNLRDYNKYDFNFKSTANELYKITKEGGVIVWVVGDATVKGSETGTSFKQALYFKKIGFNLHDTMIYEKNIAAFPPSNRYCQQFEYMFILSKNKPKTTNIQVQSKKHIPSQKHKGYQRNKDGTTKIWNTNSNNNFIKMSNVWKFNVGYMQSSTDKISFQHPAIFPEALAKRHILSWSNEGDTILDPMAGSGTVATMCEQLNRKWISIEISKEYCEIIKQRVEKENKKQKEYLKNKMSWDNLFCLFKRSKNDFYKINKQRI